MALDVNHARMGPTVPNASQLHGIGILHRQHVSEDVIINLNIIISHLQVV